MYISVDNFLRHWKSLRFDNESDVREDFVTPLLWTLGYAKNTVNDIVREKHFKLGTKGYSMRGSQRVRVDYIPTLRLKRFWLIEAKLGDDRILSEEDLLQAHFYAIHPEVQARFIVLTNGLEIRLYDAYPPVHLKKKASLYDDYIMICRQADCERTFDQLYNFLNAKTMLASIQDHMIVTLRQTLEVEIDEGVPDRLKDKLTWVLEGAKPRIAQNARQLQQQAWQEFFAENRQQREALTFDELLVHMNIPRNAQLVYGQEMVRRFMAQPYDERGAMLTTLIQTFMGRPHAVFRVHCADIIMQLVLMKADVPSIPGVPTLMDGLLLIAGLNMSYCGGVEILEALTHLDNTTLRVAKKFCMRFTMKPIEDQLSRMKATLPAEDWVRDIAGVAGRMVAATSQMAQIFWQRYAYLPTAAEVWNGIWSLEALETVLDRMPAPTYPKGDSDILHFEWYGLTLDILSLGTHEILRRARSQLAEMGAPPSLLTLADMERDTVVRNLSKPKAPPPEFDQQGDDWLKNLITAVTGAAGAEMNRYLETP